MGIVLTAVIIFVVSITLKFMGETILLLGWGKTIQNHAPGPCRIIDGVENGSEDIQTLPNGLAFITSGLKFLGEVGNPKFKHVKGKIHLFDFNQPEAPPIDLKLEGGPGWEDFAPHGMSIWNTKDNVTHIYIINHLIQGDQVEKFRFDERNKKLVHLKSIKDVSFRILNDLSVVEDDQFYVTNYVSSLGEPGWTIERLARLKWGQVVFYDGSRGHMVADGMTNPNGINISPDKNYVFVACPGEKSMHIYQRLEGNILELKEVLNVDGRWDNIDVNTESGQVELWIGAHPIAWQFRSFRESKRESAPSQVLRLIMDGAKVVSINEVYADNGHRLFGSSVAVKFKDAMLVGTVDHKLMYCHLNHIGV